MEGWQVNGKWSKRKASCIGGWGDLSALVDDETLDLQPRTGKLSSSSRLCYNCFVLVWKLDYILGKKSYFSKNYMSVTLF